MMKFIAAFFLLICGFVVLLATVDLEPYLTSIPPDNREDVYISPLPGEDEPPIKTDANVQAERKSSMNLVQKQNITRPDNTQQAGLFENNAPAATEQEITIGQEHTATPPLAKVNDNIELGQLPSSLIEMEMTILPESKYPFSILLETFLKQEPAQQAILTYHEHGISTHWTKVNIGNSVIRYRLFTGAFSTEVEAQLYLEQHRLEGKLIKPTYFSARVGVYQNKFQLITDFTKSRESGVIPYILSTKEGDYYLYVGAFYTYIGATAQCRYLAEAGLNCEPVKRSTIPPQQP